LTTVQGRFHQHAAGVRHVLMLTYLCLLCTSFSFAFGIYYWVEGIQVGALICVYGSVSAGGLVWWMYRFRSIGKAGQFFCLTTLVFFLLFSFFSGGIASPLVPWLGTAPLAGSLLLRNWETWLLTGISLFLLLVLYWLTPYFPNPGDYGFQGKEKTISLIAHSGYVLFCFGIVLTIELVRSDMARLERITSAESAENLAGIKALVASRDKERQRIARELHDHIGTVITVVRLRHESLVDSESLQERGSEFFKHLESIGDQIGAVSKRFSLHVLRDFGLENGLRYLESEFRNKTKKPVDFILTTPMIPVLEAQAVQFYRITQEILDGPAAHSAAEGITLQLLVLSDKIRYMAEIQGNGLANWLGSDAEWEFRLAEIKDRTRVMGGEFVYETSPASGLTLIIETPLEYGED